ncbi:hypothetical protein CYLTODRAFT_391905 [Cylindrobasidium torrendii FP15055 ss-10]|uniref:Nicotinamide N-methyltransferase n=1 Tax=Cylindrobasidium torrendii FP15055 ss-10 TaxID=1314674 RepID=A0A0D7BJD3_9AGAR|nr:hypothetical protein CYLTODRAFT_391905 [Cylindrobasidium torrendii FP15055 ss-10]
MASTPIEDPEDILCGSLQSLYNYEPITLTSAGAAFVYKTSFGPTIYLQTPDTEASNWALHASSIWNSSRFIADHIDSIPIPHEHARILELGAGAGLPGITLALRRPDAEVVVSDYPDAKLIQTLTENVERNVPQGNARAAAYGWGTDTKVALGQRKFDVVVAADTLWNSEFHALLVRTLDMVLEDAGKVYLVAGLHTGRYTLDAFFKAVTKAGFAVESADEMRVDGGETRKWDATRPGADDDRERRRWVVWVVLKRSSILP